MNKKYGLRFGAIVLVLIMLNGAVNSTTTVTVGNHDFEIKDEQCVEHMQKIIQIEESGYTLETVNIIDDLATEGITECKNNEEVISFLNWLHKFLEAEENKEKLAAYEKADREELAAIRAERSGEGTGYQDNAVVSSYTVDQLFSIVTFSNTDLKNKRLSKQLIANRTIVTDQCQVTEVDYSGSEYEINCRLPGRKQFLTLYSNSDDVENIGRGQTIRFEGTIESLDAKNDWLDMQILKVNIRSWS